MSIEPNMPRSRYKLAIPFVGKDVPASASEFAHPDVLIILTVLAHRYEGLRYDDFEQEVIGQLRSQLEKEVGPHAERSSAKLYERWVEAAGGMIKGNERAVAKGASQDGVDDEKVVVPLWLLKQSNDEQMAKGPR